MVPARKAPLTITTRSYAGTYQSLILEGKSRREARQIARNVSSGIKTAFTPLEVRFIEEHPEYENRVSEYVEEVRDYIGFEVINNEPLVDADWMPSKINLSLCNINLVRAKKSFRKAKHYDQYIKLLKYLDDNPEYIYNVFDPVLEAVCGAFDEKEDAKKEAEEAKKKEEEAEKNHPKKQPKSPRGTYSAMPDPPVTPITE